MNGLPFFIIGFFILASSTINSQEPANSPFNYGQNKSVYFISKKEREKLAINSICEIAWEDEDDDYFFTVWKFTGHEISSASFIWKTDQKTKFNFESISKEASDFRIYFHYILKNGKLAEYGSAGRGVHDWNRIKRYQGISIVETSTGGGGSPPHLRYTKNKFKKTGRLQYSINYPEVNDTLLDIFLPDDTISLKWFNYHIRNVIVGEHVADTVRYMYNLQGLLTGIGKKKIDISRPASFFKMPFSQSDVYIGNTKMETHIKRRLGYLPRLILVEIYQYGVMSFFLDEKNKYRTGKSVILEKEIEYE